MSQTFDPKRVLRQVSNHLLQDLFEAHHHDLELPWEQMEETDVDAIFNAWQTLPEADCRAIEIVLHEVSDMASGEEGTKVISEEALRQQNQELLDELEGFESRHDKAIWTYIRAIDVWNLAVRFARADSLSHGRYWIKRCDIPAKVPNTGGAKLHEFEESLSAFFIASQARGRHCQVEHYVRASGVDYFFAYLDDYADTYVTLDTDGEFDRRPERRAFELVFVYDRAHGTLEMYAKGGKKVYIPLQEIFCSVILDEAIGPENRQSHPYELNGLISRDFQFPTDPEDGITAVRVAKLRLSLKGQSRSRVTFEPDPEGKIDDVYDMMDAHLNQEQMPASIFNVTQVGFAFTFDEADESLPRSMSFEVSWPNSSNLKSRPDGVRELAEKYLRLWELDRADNHEDAQPAPGIDASNPDD